MSVKYTFETEEEENAYWERIEGETPYCLTDEELLNSANSLEQRNKIQILLDISNSMADLIDKAKAGTLTNEEEQQLKTLDEKFCAEFCKGEVT